MPAERMPHRSQPKKPARHYSWISVFLQPLTRFVIRHPFIVLILALILAGTGVWGTINRLEFKTSRLDLINPQSEFNKRWLKYIESFGSEDDIVVIVEGKDSASIEQATNSLGAALDERSDLFFDVFYKADNTKIKKKGLHYCSSAELQNVIFFLQESAAMGQGERQDVLNRLWTSWQMCVTPAESTNPSMKAKAQEGFNRLSKSLQSALGPQFVYESPLYGLGDANYSVSGRIGQGPDDLHPDVEYLWAKQNAMALILLKFKQKDGAAFAQNTESISVLREIIKTKQEEFPNVKLGLTGLPIMENDEMSSSEKAMNWATILSLIGVAGLFIFAFRGLRYSILLMTTLLIGIAWTMDYVVFGVGHLNILSIAFSAILVGLGVDFGIHYLARYSTSRFKGANIPGAILKTSKEVGSGIFVGALTTSIAFAAAGGQEFIGVAELGKIAGVGILLCALAALLVLPAQTLLTDKVLHNVVVEEETFRIKMSSITDIFSKNFWSTIIVFAGAMALCFMFIPELKYDHNLMNLQAKGVESVEWEKRLMAESDQNVWFALSMTKDKQEVKRLKEAFLQQPNITRVEEIVSRLPDSTPEKTQLIQQIHQYSGMALQRLSNMNNRMPATPNSSDLSAFLTAIEYSPEISAQTRDMYNAFNFRIRELRRRFNNLSSEEVNLRLKQFEMAMSQDYCARLQQIYLCSDPEPPTMADLPKPWVDRLYSKDGYYALQIYGSGDIWDMENLTEFVKQVRAVDPEATGNPLQTYECSLQMQRSYISAAWYALAGIMTILFIDLKSLRYTLMAMTPLITGILFLFGLMGFMQIPLNSANMIILPLILGIGIDDGVHIVHDYRRRDKTKPFRISPSTAGALTMTSLTSILGFCSLMTAEHRGLQSLGMVLTMGVACCMFTSLSILPTILTRASKWGLYREARRRAKRERKAQQQAGSAQDLSETPNSGNANDDFIPISGSEPIPLWKLEAYLNNSNQPQNKSVRGQSGAA